MWWLQKAFFSFKKYTYANFNFENNTAPCFFMQTQVNEILSFDSLGYI